MSRIEFVLIDAQLGFARFKTTLVLVCRKGQIANKLGGFLLQK
jgi:hypothetical protein